MVMPFGGPPKRELPFHSHKTLEYLDGADFLIVDCYTCTQQFVSVEDHVVSVNGPYGPHPEGYEPDE